MLTATVRKNPGGQEFLDQGDEVPERCSVSNYAKFAPYPRELVSGVANPHAQGSTNPLQTPYDTRYLRAPPRSAVIRQYSANGPFTPLFCVRSLQAAQTL